jgi:toxin ParE1/3/4
MAGRRRVTWSPASEQDLREIWRYYFGAASRDVADRMIRAISAAAEKAAEHPTLRRRRDDLLPGLRAVLVHPYVLCYRLDDDGVEIVRILHQKRNLKDALKQEER